jgi:Domain of Unknown Function (DUF1080)
MGALVLRRRLTALTIGRWLAFPRRQPSDHIESESPMSRYLVHRHALLAIASCSAALAVVVSASALATNDSEWIELIGEHSLDAWRKPAGDWLIAGDAALDPANAKRLTAKPGTGVIVNGTTGKTRNLVTKEDFGDLEAHFEFLIPKGSNSGVKFEALYEIQIFDSSGVAEPKASHCGGVYPRAELLPRYHYLDAGVPPLVNAARLAGEWQTLDVIFRAPRFGPGGPKSRSARLEKAVLNGRVIHENVELKTPTGHAWRLKEVARGPILLQGDHGPVAFRNIRVKRLD